VRAIRKRAEVHLAYADFGPPPEGEYTEYKGHGGWFAGNSYPLPKPTIMRKALDGKYTHVSIEWLFWRLAKAILLVLGYKR
jgi:hypothetical protein